MKCSECGDTSFTGQGGYKIKIERLGVKAVPAVYRPNYYVESEPYLIICPTCFSQMFQYSKFKKDVTSIETQEVTGNI